MKFHLIQRGRFEAKKSNFLGIIYLEYMGAAEFEFGAIPASFERIMHDFTSYAFISTGITNKSGNELMLFVKSSLVLEILSELKKFIANPYGLKRFSKLELVPNADNLDINFWWGLDQGRDWMAFLKPNMEYFQTHIQDAYNLYCAQSKEPKLLKALAHLFKGGH